jgi:hypothetical protein
MMDAAAALDEGEQADLAELMAGMFGEVAVAVEGEARGNVAAVVAARRRERSGRCDVSVRERKGGLITVT